MATNETRVPMIFGVIIPLTCLAFFAVTLRVYTRAVLVRNAGIDDYFAIISFILIFACSFDILWSIKYGLGTHIATLTPQQVTNYLKAFYASIIFYIFALSAIRITLLTQYYRAFAAKETQKALLVATVIVSCWCLSQICLSIFTCIPLSTFWDRGNGGKCLPNNPTWYINAGGNIMTDLIIIVIPLPCLINLRLPRRQRYILVAIFCVGLFTCAISLIRIQYLDMSPDLEWDNPVTAAWSVAELCCGLLCACLPTLRPLVSRILPRFLSSRQFSPNLEQRQEHVSGHTYRDIELSNGIERRGTGKGSQRNRDNQDRETGEQISIDIVLEDDERRLTEGSGSKPQPIEMRWLRD